MVILPTSWQGKRTSSPLALLEIKVLSGRLWLAQLGSHVPPKPIIEAEGWLFWLASLGHAPTPLIGHGRSGQPGWPLYQNHIKWQRDRSPQEGMLRSESYVHYSYCILSTLCASDTVLSPCRHHHGCPTAHHLGTLEFTCSCGQFLACWQLPTSSTCISLSSSVPVGLLQYHRAQVHRDNQNYCARERG